MYIVKLDGQLMFDPRVDELKVSDLKLNLEVNTAGTFNFTIYPSHPLYDNINKLKSVIEVYQDNILLFRGRPLNDQLDFYNVKKVICEGDLAFLNDSIQRPYEYSGTVSDYLEQLIVNHNAEVTEDRQFTLGNVTVIDANDYITRADSSYPKTWETIKTKLLDLLGGYIMVRRQGGINYIDYLDDSTATSLQTIRLGENLIDVNQSREGQEIYTAIVPLGATLKDEDGKDYQIDIKSVNGGLDYIYDEEAVEQYGYIFRMLEFKDITLPNNLLIKAQQTLAEAIGTVTSIDLKAIDLNMLDVNIDDFRIFEKVKVESTIHQLDEYYLIKKLSLDLTNPRNNSLSIGRTYKSFTERQYDAENVIRTISKDYVKNEAVQEIKSEIQTVSSNITQEADNIRLQVAEGYTAKTEFSQYKSEVGTEFSQVSDAFTFQFTQLMAAINSLDTDTQVQFTEIIKYIRFIDGNIVLGQINNPYIVNISNTKVSFLQDNVEVAYISNNKLYVFNGEFINSLKIGNFGFTPRANGNLSFGKVV